MSAADSGIASVIDSAMPAVDSAAVESTPVVETPTETTDAFSTPAETPAVEGEKSPADATEKPTDDPKGSIGSPTPQDVHKALQAFKDLDPEKNGAMAKQLNGTLQRHYAMLKEFPNVEAAREASSALKELAGTTGDWKQGLESLRGVKAAAEASDAKLYDPAQNAELISDVVADLRAQGKLENLGTLASSLWDATKEHSPAAYVEHQRSLFLSTASETGLTDSLNSIHSALLQGDTKGALAKLKSIGNYFNDLSQMESDREKEKAIVSRERQALGGEQSKATAATKAAFTESVGREARSGDSRSLGVHLAPILRLPYFKGYDRSNLQGLGNSIQSALFTALKADSAYQSKIAGLWKDGDRAAILKFHRTTVESKAKEIVTSTVAKMYKGYTTGSVTAGRAAASAASAGGNTITKEQLYNSNFKMPTPVKLAKRPDNLVRDFPQAGVYQINAKGAIPNGKGGFTWVTWNR